MGRHDYAAMIQSIKGAGSEMGDDGLTCGGDAAFDCAYFVDGAGWGVFVAGDECE
jgi:hypothetical protein